MEKYRKFIGKKVVIVLSLLCYLMACIFTPFYYSNMPPTEDYLFGSLFCLLLGWAGTLFHEGFLKVYFLAWYSNITYVFAIRSLIKDKYKCFLTLSSITFGLSLLFAFCPEVIIDEAGHTQMITMAAGYYLWVGSFFVLLIGGLYVLFVQNRKGDKRLMNDGRMKSKQQIFFLTKADIVKMMSMVEIRIPIEYTLMGAFKQEAIRRENTISNFSKLGHTGYANWISLDNRYMVLPLNNEVKYRIVKQRNGSFHYIVDLASNPTGVELSTGGIYDNAENVLIAGRVAVFTDSSIEAMQIYKEILRAMNKCFTRKNNIFVSQEVLSLLEDGWRLTCNYNAPCENDLVVDQ